MGGKIDSYVDCVSPYSYFAFLHLIRNREALKAHNIEIEAGLLKPFYLGNKPPWMLPARANYLKYDRERAIKYFETPNVKPPDVFPIVSLLPQRAQAYIKKTYPDKFEPMFLTLWNYLWESNKDVSNPEVLSAALSEHFSKGQIEEILKAAQSPEWKQALNDKTKEALEKGAYGAPWHWVRSEAGGKVREEPFFGSDRFTLMWQFLGIPIRDVEILKPGEAKL